MTMFRKILVANRGEIACRIIKTAKRLGIATVAVYSDADRKALHVEMADEAVYIGPSPSTESYLLAQNIIEAACKTKAQAIHPGYGFLSENAEFCKRCENNDIIFIGPPASAIEAMGSKSAAKTIMDAAGVPLVPGYHGESQATETLKAAAMDMGFPVLLKAAAGGGGKGLRPVFHESEFDEALASAKRESLACFDDDKMLVEKYLHRPRHIEVQIFCDQHGGGVYLFERDCSIQRRHQKIIEEAPAPRISEAQREMLGTAALRAAQAIHYCGAGTVEFLVDTAAQAEQGFQFFFMEMNTRLQVEHPVTEFITGEDLVEWQFRVAAGEALPRKQDQLSIKGHAFESRIYAEDPYNNFFPSTGSLEFLQVPKQSQHTRVDTGVLEGDAISVYYDPMIAKLIVWGENRDEARVRMQAALSEFRVVGPKTNIPFLKTLFAQDILIEGKMNTGFIDEYQDQLLKHSAHHPQESKLLAALYILLRREIRAQGYSHDRVDYDKFSPWNKVSSWRLNSERKHRGIISIGKLSYEIEAVEHGEGDERFFTMTAEGQSHRVSGSLSGRDLRADIDGYRVKAHVVERRSRDRVKSSSGESEALTASLFFNSDDFEFSLDLPMFDSLAPDEQVGSLLAPMNGRVIALLVENGQAVKKGDALVITEAMKMEHTIKSPFDGVVEKIYCNVDELVEGGNPLVAITQ